MEVNSTVSNDSVKVIESVEDNDNDNDKPAPVELPQNQTVVHEVDAKKGNIVLKNSEGATQKCSSQWLHIGRIKLTSNDRDAIMDRQKLNDLVINFAQKVLKMQFPSVKGFQSTLIQDKKGKGTFEQDKVQIIHSRGNHWIVATTIYRSYFI